jgi:hypothetical protein
MRAQLPRGLSRVVRRLVVLLVFVSAHEAAAAPSSHPMPFPVVDGSVEDVLVRGSTADVAGSFEPIGPASGPLAVVSAADGRITRAFPGFAGQLPAYDDVRLRAGRATVRLHLTTPGRRRLVRRSTATVLVDVRSAADGHMLHSQRLVLRAYRQW